MKKHFRKPSVSILLTLLFSIWVGVIFYHHYPRLWSALRDPWAAARNIPPRYMNLGVAGVGLLVLTVLAVYFGLAALAALLSDARLGDRGRLAVSLLAAGLILGLVWFLCQVFRHYPRLLDAGLNLALLLMIVLLSAYAGRKLFHALGPKPDSSLEAFLFSAALGLGLLTYATLALALLGLLYAWLAWLILGVLGMAWALDQVFRSTESVGASKTSGFVDVVGEKGAKNLVSGCLRRLGGFFGSGFSVKKRAADILLISLVSIYLLINLIGALAPEIEVDALVYHLYIPKVYIQNHRLVYIPYEFRTAFPLGMEMLFTLGMLLRDSILAKLIHFSLGVLTLLATYCFGRKHFSSRVGLLAAAIFYTVSMVAWSSTTAYIDLGTTFFTTLEIFALVNWWHSRRDRWLAVAAILCGLAMGTKYLGVFGLVILVVGILLKLSFAGQRDVRGALRTILTYAVIPVLMVSPWLIKNYVFTGNPVYPLLNNVFKSPLMPPINPTFDRAKFGMGDNVFTKYILSPWNVTFHGEAYRGVIGPIFLIFLPFLSVVKVDKVIRYLLLFCGLFFVLWLVSFPIIRYLMPILPFLSIIVGYVIGNLVGGNNWRNAVLSAEVVAVTGMTLFLNLPFFHPLWQEGWSAGIIRQVPYEVVLGIESREHYLSRHVSSYEVFQYANRNLPPEAKILCFNEEFRYLSDRTLVPVFSFEAGGIVASRNVGELLGHLQDLSITHFLINWAFIEDTQRGLTILQDDFLDQHLDPLYGNDSVALHALSFEALPHKIQVWQEGEGFVSQAGAGAGDFKTLASNGQCLGMGWGGSRGDFAEYEVSIPQALPSAALFVRYAREGPTGAALDVHLDEQLVGTSPSVRLPPTGGWGYEAEEWAYRRLFLGPVDQGKHRVRFISRSDGGTVNMDGFFVADGSFQPPDDVHRLRGY